MFSRKFTVLKGSDEGIHVQMISGLRQLYSIPSRNQNTRPQVTSRNPVILTKSPPLTKAYHMSDVEQSPDSHLSSVETFISYSFDIHFNFMVPFVPRSLG